MLIKKKTFEHLNTAFEDFLEGELKRAAVVKDDEEDAEVLERQTQRGEELLPALEHRVEVAQEGQRGDKDDQVREDGQRRQADGHERELALRLEHLNVQAVVERVHTARACAKRVHLDDGEHAEADLERERDQVAQQIGHEVDSFSEAAFGKR